jgi:excisionase family DNA binding protein
MRSPISVLPLLVPPKEAARMLATSEKTIQRMTRRGELPVVMIGDRPKYAVADLQAWVAARAASDRTTTTPGGTTPGVVILQPAHTG